MKPFLTLLLFIGILLNLQAQDKFWDGGAGTNNWNDAANWNPDGEPLSTEWTKIDPGNTVIISSGTMANVGLLTNQGSVNVESGGTLNAGGFPSANAIQNEANSEFTNSGTINIDNPAGDGFYVGVSTTCINHGTINIAYTSAGTNFTVIGNFVNEEDGEIFCSGNTGVSAVMNVSFSDADFTNEGNIQISSATVTSQGIKMSNGAQFTNAPGGVITMNMSSNVNGIQLNDNNTTLTNYSTILLNDSRFFNGTGSTYDSQNGLLYTNGNSITTFKLTGGGTVNTNGGNIAVLGELSPGNSPGSINMFSNLEIISIGSYRAELAGTTSNDQVGVMGNLSLDGTLNVDLLDGFVPTITDQFTIMTFSGTLTGTFANLNLPSPEMDGWVVDYGVEESGKILLAHPSSLPVELISFTAYEEPNENTQLDWSTASELNNAGFEIQHATDGKNWNVLSFVNGKGTTSETQQYNYIDHRSTAGDHYYRLKQLDNDGTFAFSHMVHLFLDKANFSIYPNPSNNIISLDVDLDEFDFLNIRSREGVLVFSTALNSNTLDISQLPAGLYFVALHTKSGQVTTGSFSKTD